MRDSTLQFWKKKMEEDPNLFQDNNASQKTKQRTTPKNKQKENDIFGTLQYDKHKNKKFSDKHLARQRYQRRLF